MLGGGLGGSRSMRLGIINNQRVTTSIMNSDSHLRNPLSPKAFAQIVLLKVSLIRSIHLLTTNPYTLLMSLLIPSKSII